MEIKSLDKKRFDAFVQQSRRPATSFISEELSWWSTPDESVIGVVVQDNIDNDYAGIVLGRDEIGQYRAFDVSNFFDAPDEARDWLHRAMKWHARDGDRVFPQGDTRKAVDFFSPVVPESKMHPYFLVLRNSEAHLPAREILNLIAPHFHDVDGNFVEQFQTTGFDSRIWELYLHSYLAEEELFISRKYNAPDFIVEKYGEKIGIEAVIVGRKASNPARYFKLHPRQALNIDVRTEHENAMPIRFGSPLFTKLQKRYWELPQIENSPLVFAIADFHDDQSMTWSSTALINYLYGVKHDFHYDNSGKLVISPIQIEKHVLDGKEIPSGFFFQPDTENVSAVLFSASGTISKFNRMGRQAGFVHPDVRMIRFGSCHNHDENASLPNTFMYEVDESSSETWAEGISMFHNPNAKHPVPVELFPSAAHHSFSDGNVISFLPEFYPYSSMTWNLKVKR